MALIKEPKIIILEQEQSGVFEHLWQPNMESPSAMTGMSSAMSRWRWWGVTVTGTPLGGARKAQTISLDTWIRTPSGHWCEWDLHPLWAIRNKSSDYPALELGLPRVTHVAQLDFHSPSLCCHYSHPDWLPASLHEDTTGDQNFRADICSAQFLWKNSPSHQSIHLK